MGKILVAGIMNLETSVAVEGFPLEYTKSRFAFHGVKDRPGGVGYNVSRAMAHLGAPVEFVTMLGKDLLGEVLLRHLSETEGLGMAGVLRVQESSLRSTILVEPTGRASMFTDLKDSQDIAYPAEHFRSLLPTASILHASNINWAFALAQEARQAGVLVATDVQAIRHIDEPYNRRFLSVADIVFLSAENLEAAPHDVIARIFRECPARMVFCTRAEKGLLLGERHTSEILELPAITSRPVRNVTGAGDAFAAATLAALEAGHTPRAAAQRGQIVAGWRIGEEGGGHGLPSREWIEAQTQALLC